MARQWFWVAVFFLASALLPVSSNAATYTADLGVRADDISFDPPTLIIGETVRVYATVHNFGTKDVRGTVLFYQGATPIGEPQNISVRAQGFADEVFVDMKVPEGPFNVLVRVRDTAPADENLGNNEALSPLFTPVADADRDGIADGKDNCPQVANPDQSDADRDNLGNACDPDDDNDGVSDIEEATRGTNPNSPDSDGDGVSDNKDAYPLDGKRSIVEVVKPTPIAVKPPEPVKKEVAKPAIIPVARAAEKEATEVPAETPSMTNDKPIPSKVLLAAAVTERTTWNTFAFDAKSSNAPKGAQYFWEFGDGGGSEGKEVTHTYKSPGDYIAVLTLRDGSNAVSRDSMPVSVSFWNFSNPRIWVLVGLLGVVMLWMLGVLLRK